MLLCLKYVRYQNNSLNMAMFFLIKKVYVVNMRSVRCRVGIQCWTPDTSFIRSVDAT